LKQRRDPQSPFGLRVHFENAEFESMMDELRSRAGAETLVESEGVDVDRVLSRGLGIEADYVELPEGVLGRTLFRRDGKARVEISRALAEAAEDDVVARRRLRTTAAHEIGHVVCHTQLVIEDSRTPSLFPNAGQDRPAPKVLCREEGVGNFRYRGEWWEYQANQCMACLLLPRAPFIARAKTALQASGASSFEEAIREGREDDLIRGVSRCFDVSFEAVFYRLQALGFVPEASQPRLPLGNG